MLGQEDRKLLLYPPRYYQRIAINRTVEAIASGKDRALLVMATGTGKTYMAFQIIWRLWKSGLKKRILYLADRNILIDQTIIGDFKPFKNSMTKIYHKKENLFRKMKMTNPQVFYWKKFVRKRRQN